LQRLARHPAEVMVMTGTRPIDALDAMEVGDPEVHADLLDRLHGAVARSIAAAACLCADTFREDEAIRRYYGVTGDAHRAQLNEHKAPVAQDREVLQEALRDSGHVDREALINDEDNQRLLLIECAALLKRAPALFEAGQSVMEVVDAMEVSHPLACHLAHRLKEDPTISYFGRPDPDLAVRWKRPADAGPATDD